MANHHDKYKRRLHRNGKDVGEVYNNNTVAFINATFHASPTFRVLEVDSLQHPTIKEIDARITEIERMGTLREVNFRPNEGLDMGAYVKFDEDTWIVYDKYGGVGSTSIKVLVAKCNRTIKWIDADNITHEFNCISSATDLGSKAKQSKNEIEWNKYDVRLPLGQLFVFVTLNKATDKINLNQRFIFGRNVYEVTGIDDVTAVNKEGFGVIQLTVKITTVREQDDFTTNIAQNLYGIDVPTTTMGIQTLKTEEDQGGKLW